MKLKLALALAGLALSAAAGAGPLDPCSTAALAADIESCDERIAAEQDAGAKAALLVRRAWTHNEHKKYEEALKDLDQALTLDPDNGKALMERGFTLNALGEYARALADLDKEAALRPNAAAVYSERAFSRHHLGDLAGAHADREEVVARHRTAASLLARAEAGMWMAAWRMGSRDDGTIQRLRSVGVEHPERESR